MNNDEHILELRLTPKNGNVDIRQIFGKELTDAEILSGLETALIQCARIANISPLDLVNAIVGDIHEVVDSEYWYLNDDEKDQ